MNAKLLGLGVNLWDNKRQQRWDYILVLTLICFSGNPFFLFTPLVRELHIALTFLLASLILIRNKGDIIIKYFFYVAPIFVIMLYHLVKIYDASMSTNIFMLMKMFIGVSVICLVGKRFIYVYVHAMIILTIISLACWLYNVFFGLIPGAVSVTEVCSSIIVHTQDIYNVQNGHSRNSGMFWEPGAYQGFLNLALLFSMRLSGISQKKYKVLILLLGVLSTQSTTGYVVLMLVGLIYIFESKGVSSSSKALLFVLFLIASFYTYTGVSFLGDKIEDNISDTSTSQGRVTDFIKYQQLIGESPLIGNSYNSEVTSGNGFFYQIVSIGFIGTLYLFAYLFIKVRKNTTPFYALLFVITIIVIFNGEVFVTMPLFMALPFVEFPKQSKLRLY